jgi:hypothetical protein
MSAANRQVLEAQRRKAGRQKKPQRPEITEAPYMAIPIRLLDSMAYLGASPRAKTMLVDLARQHDGYNNGHLQLSVKWLRGRDWTSNEWIQQAKVELIGRRLIVKTRNGGMGIGPDRYALTWLPISNFTGLEISLGDYRPGAWSGFTGRDDRSSDRNGLVPATGTLSQEAFPATGTLDGVLEPAPVPVAGNNVVSASARQGVTGRKRVVGRAGRSGMKSVGRVAQDLPQTATPSTGAH